MIPLLLCALHIAKTLDILGEKRHEEGGGGRSILLLGGAVDAVLVCEDPFQEQASTIRGRRDGPETVGFCGGNGFGRDS